MSARRRSTSISQNNGSSSDWNIFGRTHNRTRSVATDDPFERASYRNSVLSSSMNQTTMNQSARSRYIKIAAVLSFVLLALYFLSGGSKSGVSSVIPGSTSTAGGSSTKKNDPSCTRYVLMIDAGSSGSRIHVYRFNTCTSTPELENEGFKMIKGGLSSYSNDPEAAARSLDELMDLAVTTVPEKYKACTPVAVKATAGLRLLGAEKSDAILAAVRNRLETKYPFPVVEGNGVAVMDGSDEGVYAWITTNYLLGKIGGPDKSPTAAVFDLGGASTQIVFEPTFPIKGGGMPEILAPGDHHYDLNFGGRSFDLYQHSHLGYGLNEARKAVHKAILSAKFGDSPIDNSKPILNPCIAPGMWREVEIDGIKVNMTGPPHSAAPLCRSFAESILHKDEDCKLAPCSFNGIHQPSLAKTFAREDVYIFSYFYDRTQPLGMPSSFTLEELRDLAAKVCEGESGWTMFSAVKGALEELRDRPEHCLDLNFQLALLHTGYEMPLHREVKIAKKIKGNELGWCLGASLPLLAKDSGWKCRIREVGQH
ncbi:Guanosine-diphosphatase, variant 2 [Orbilia oligospora]|uniref:guanosine-diphosphatase n=1 Tax=Orbilia oligospora TaxID=2813651 RepID=A0A7C8PKL2_ORBOL|nr:Guanosine-diphosphatase [Orbilia oligospora]KAF3168779.1 Guanosine-diphosphatase [Orbilia oligospora]KAF3168780.1 Guanosine-diphosphatase, variant 2 [Orbilia oligospora]KAF3242849.1 Guanosine-diphosphatase [Orbilia oligospora]KAF3243770.1 Guanosine-diphosphatase [Orbilia oligospora]